MKEKILKAIQALEMYPEIARFDCVQEALACLKAVLAMDTHFESDVKADKEILGEFDVILSKLIDDVNSLHSKLEVACA